MHHFDVSTEHPIIRYIVYSNTFFQTILYLLQLFWLKVILAAFFRTLFGSNDWVKVSESKEAQKLAAQEAAALAKKQAKTAVATGKDDEPAVSTPPRQPTTTIQMQD